MASEREGEHKIKAAVDEKDKVSSRVAGLKKQIASFEARIANRSKGGWFSKMCSWIPIVGVLIHEVSDFFRGSTPEEQLANAKASLDVTTKEERDAEKKVEEEKAKLVKTQEARSTLLDKFE